MAVDKTNINRWSGLALMVVILCFIVVLLLQLASLVFKPSKTTCTVQVCLTKFLEGPPAFNDDYMARYLRNNFFVAPTGGEYKLTGINGRDAVFTDVVKYIGNYFGRKSKGTFVVLGAGDGEYYDYSLPLEQDLQWSGLLIEPQEELFNLLHKKGRKAQMAKACVSPYSYPAKIKMSHRYFDNSTTSAAERVQRLRENKIHLFWNDTVGSTTPFMAQCIPLENLVYAAGIKKAIDLLVMDMSGTDLDILLNTKFDQMPDVEMIVVSSFGSNIASDINGYFLERNMVVKKTFGNSITEAIYILAKFDAERDLIN